MLVLDEPTALYRLYDQDDELLYVGISNNPERRFLNHRTTKPWWASVESTQIDWYETRLQAARAETKAIATEKPRFNIHQTPAWREAQAADARAISPEARRNRSIGLKARFAQVRKYRDLVAQGVPEQEAREQGAVERERYLEAAFLSQLPGVN